MLADLCAKLNSISDFFSKLLNYSRIKILMTFDECPTSESIILLKIRLINYSDDPIRISSVKLFSHGHVVKDNGYNYDQSKKRKQKERAHQIHNEYIKDLRNAVKKAENRKITQQMMGPFSITDKASRQKVRQGLINEAEINVKKRYPKKDNIFIDAQKLLDMPLNELETDQKYKSYNFNYDFELIPKGSKIGTYWIDRRNIPTKVHVVSYDRISVFGKSKWLKIE